jgi:FkbM family methyltransferase
VILPGPHEPPFFAQFGEDRILDEIFAHRGFGTCVEVGANDGVTDSMTYHFELLGWTCILVEPIPELFLRIVENRKCISHKCAASSSEGEVTLSLAEGVPSMSTLELTRGRRASISKAGGTSRDIKVCSRTMDSILADSCISNIDFISIDVEGHEMEVLKGFSIENYCPKIVLIEDNSNASDPTIPEFMKGKGYLIFKRTGVNDWYAMESDRELLPAGKKESLMNARNRVALEYRLGQRFSSVFPYVPNKLKPIIRKILGIGSN